MRIMNLITYWCNTFSSLSDLHGVGNHSGVDGGTGCSDSGVHLVGKLNKNNNSSIHMYLFKCTQRKMAIPVWCHGCNLKKLGLVIWDWYFKGRVENCSPCERVLNKIYIPFKISFDFRRFKYQAVILLNLRSTCVDPRRPLQGQDLLLLVKGNRWRGSIKTTACSLGAFIRPFKWLKS